MQKFLSLFLVALLIILHIVESSPCLERELDLKYKNKSELVSNMSPKAKTLKTNINDTSPNADIARKLLELAEYEKNATGSSFKFNSYRKAALSLNRCPSRIKSGEEAKNLKGIGKTIAAVIDEYLKKGKMTKLEDLRKNKEVNEIMDLTRVHGIGPAKARDLVEEGYLCVEDIKEDPKELNRQQQIGLKYIDDFEKKIPRAEIDKIKEIIEKTISDLDNRYSIEICGAYRREQEWSDDIDVLISHPDIDSAEKKGKCGELLKKFVQALESASLIIETISIGNTRFTGVCRLDKDSPARRINIVIAAKDSYYLSLLYLTGSSMFNIDMREQAAKKGFILTQYAIQCIDSRGIHGKPLKVNSEEDVFKYLDMEYKKPSERNMDALKKENN